MGLKNTRAELKDLRNQANRAINEAQLRTLALIANTKKGTLTLTYNARNSYALKTFGHEPEPIAEGTRAEILAKIIPLLAGYRT